MSIYVPIFKYSLGSLACIKVGKRIKARNWEQARKIANDRLITRSKKTYWKVSIDCVVGV
jgi:hypothetical protein